LEFHGSWKKGLLTPERWLFELLGVNIEAYCKSSWVWLHIATPRSRQVKWCWVVHGFPEELINMGDPELRLHVILQRLLLRVFGRPHCEDISNLVSKPYRNRQPIAIIASVVIDFSKTHDVGKYDLYLRSITRAS